MSQLWPLPSQSLGPCAGLDISPLYHAIACGSGEMFTSYPIHVKRKCVLIEDIREGFSKKVIVEMRDRKKLEMCDSSIKFNLLGKDEIVRRVGPMGSDRRHPDN